MKRRSLRTALCLALTVLLMIAATGCNQTSASTAPSVAPSASAAASGTTAAGTAVASASTEPVATNAEPTTITFMAAELATAPFKSDCLVLQQIDKVCNVKIDVSLVPGADLQTKIDTGISANQLPDVICSGQIESKYSGQGVFANLDDYINGSKSFGALFSKYPSLKSNMMNDDGHFEFIPQLTERLYFINSSINKDLLDKTGKKAPTNLTEFEDVMKAFKAYDSSVTPILPGAWTGDWWYMPILEAYDTSLDWYDFDGTGMQFGPYDRSSQLYNAIVYLNQLWNDGVIDPAAFSISDDDIMAKVETNKVGFMYQWGDGLDYSTAPGGSHHTNFVPMKDLQGPDGKAHTRVTQPFAGNYFYINGRTTADKIAAAEKWMEYDYSEAGITLTNWGVEGQTYTLDSSGNPQYTDAIMKAKDNAPGNKRREYGIAHTALPFLSLNASELQCTGPYATQLTAMVTETAYPAQPVLAGTAAEGQEFGAIMTDINKYVAEQFAKFVTGQDKISESSFAAFKSTLEQMNIKRASEIEKAQYTRWQARTSK
jgi:putative aldouronate transport system substrate-binding protein